MSDAAEKSPSSDDPSLSSDDRLTLLRVARDSIRHGLDYRTPLAVDDVQFSEALKQQRATFVTLRLGSDLRGCIGTLDARRSLVADVAHNAFAAAFRDSRFSPLRNAEFLNLHIHISILSPPVEMKVRDEADLLSQLRVGMDGLILQEPPRRATFLPDVWAMVKSPREFVTHLKTKGDWPADYWSPRMRAYRYSTMSVE